LWWSVSVSVWGELAVLALMGRPGLGGGDRRRRGVGVANDLLCWSLAAAPLACCPLGFAGHGSTNHLYSRPQRRDAASATSSSDGLTLMRTYSPRPADIDRAWYVVDAQDEILGRLASRVAHILRGKHKPMYAPHMDVGDHVIVINAAGVQLTGSKGTQSLAYRHSGFPGGLKSVPFARLLAESPDKLVERAVRGMLPKNSLGRSMMGKLKVYSGAEHPHAAQQPQPLPDHLA
jgi:large subunit ribosomal protein L13